MSRQLLPSRFLIQRQPAALEAIRRHYCDYGCSPSFRELAHRIGIPVSKVRRIILRLVGTGAIGWTAGKARSITLPRRFADASNSELLLELQRRGLPIVIGANAAHADLSAWPEATVTPECRAAAKEELAHPNHLRDLTPG